MVVAAPAATAPAAPRRVLGFMLARRINARVAKIATCTPNTRRMRRSLRKLRRLVNKLYKLSRHHIVAQRASVLTCGFIRNAHLSGMNTLLQNCAATKCQRCRRRLARLEALLCPDCGDRDAQLASLSLQLDSCPKDSSGHICRVGLREQVRTAVQLPCAGEGVIAPIVFPTVNQYLDAASTVDSDFTQLIGSFGVATTTMAATTTPEPDWTEAATTTTTATITDAPTTVAATTAAQIVLAPISRASTAAIATISMGLVCVLVFVL